MHFSRWGNKEDLEGNHDRVNRSLFNYIYFFLIRNSLVGIPRPICSRVSIKEKVVVKDLCLMCNDTVGQ